MNQKSELLKDDEINLSEFLGINRPTIAPAVPQLITNDAIGVEVELEAANHIEAPTGWGVHVDNSLRNSGVEFVFSRGMSGRSAYNAMVALCSSIESHVKAGRPPSISARTSTHVHVDMTDSTPSSLARSLAIYAIFERPLFRGFAPSRFNNHFCTRYQDCGDFLDIDRSLSAGWDTFANSYNVPSMGRYSALNIKSLFKHGTMEFRHLEATWDINLMTDWVNACLAIKRAGLSDVDFYNRFFTNCSPGFVDHLREFFPTPVANRIIECYKGNISHLNHDIILGIRYVQASMTPRIRL